MLKSQLKKKSSSKIIPVKCNDDVTQKLQDKADLYTEGNLSEWLRYAGLNCVPPKSDLVQSSKKKSKK
jgi:hypothetical protein